MHKRTPLLFLLCLTACVAPNLPDDPLPIVPNDSLTAIDSLQITLADTLIAWDEATPSVSDYTETGLPVVYIETPDRSPIDTSADKLPTSGASIVICDANGDTLLVSLVTVKGRGNTSWKFPKKPYALKFSKKTAVLGMPGGKRWCLLANYTDNTALQNATAFRISELTGLAWTPRGRFVELVLNGKHQGLYFLCEQIRINENRVNITEDTQLTGGFIMEVDAYYDEPHKFMSKKMNLPYQFKVPKEVTNEQFNYMQTYINTLEEILCDVNRMALREWEEYIDVNSFVDYMFVQELAINHELWHPKSLFVYKDVDSKLFCGPVWDFDYGAFSTSFAEKEVAMVAFYFQHLMNDPVFRAVAKQRWKMLKGRFEEIPAFIDGQANLIHRSQLLNRTIWKYWKSPGKSGDEIPFEQGAMQLKRVYIQKLLWLNEHMQRM